MVGELESRRYTAPVTFSIGCLDIRHRLPDPKVREINPRLTACLHNAGVSTPQGGACPPRSKDTFIPPIFAMGWKDLRNPKAWLCSCRLLSGRQRSQWPSGCRSRDIRCDMGTFAGREPRLSEANKGNYSDYPQSERKRRDSEAAQECGKHRQRNTQTGRGKDKQGLAPH